jgi:rare lipoprotein A
MRIAAMVSVIVSPSNGRFPVKHSKRMQPKAHMGMISLLQSGCGKKAQIRPPLAEPAAEGLQTGMASWYGNPYHGRRAASGEIYNMEEMTAAHRTLPFGTPVRVENLDNGRNIELRINDRGPFVEDRIIDVSRAAARALGMLGTGTARVRIEVISSRYRATVSREFQPFTMACRWVGF